MLKLLIPLILFATAAAGEAMPVIENPQATDRAAHEAKAQAQERAERAQMLLQQKQEQAMVEATAAIRLAFIGDMQSISHSARAKACKQQLATMKSNDPLQAQKIGELQAAVKQSEELARTCKATSVNKRGEAAQILDAVGLHHEPFSAFTFPWDGRDPYKITTEALRPTDTDRPIVYDQTKSKPEQVAQLIASAVIDERDYITLRTKAEDFRMADHALALAGKGAGRASIKDQLDAMHSRTNYLGWQAFQKRALAKQIQAEIGK